jgi:hypothetical protein
MRISYEHVHELLDSYKVRPKTRRPFTPEERAKIASSTSKKVFSAKHKANLSIAMRISRANRLSTSEK